MLVETSTDNRQRTVREVARLRERTRHMGKKVRSASVPKERGACLPRKKRRRREADETGARKGGDDLNDEATTGRFWTAPARHAVLERFTPAKIETSREPSHDDRFTYTKSKARLPTKMIV